MSYGIVGRAQNPEFESQFKLGNVYHLDKFSEPPFPLPGRYLLAVHTSQVFEMIRRGYAYKMVFCK